MKIKGLKANEIAACAMLAGSFKLENVRTIGNYVLFTLRMANCTPTRKAEREDDHHPDMRYRKLGSDMKRWTGAVCFHGHKAFMDEIFNVNPDAIIRTMRGTYKGKDEFDRTWANNGSGNIGSMFQPVQYREACNCHGG
jgi:hypothetical protein